jgi:hypothetical protein
MAAPRAPCAATCSPRPLVPRHRDLDDPLAAALLLAAHRMPVSFKVSPAKLGTPRRISMPRDLRPLTAQSFTIALHVAVGREDVHEDVRRPALLRRLLVVVHELEVPAREGARHNQRGRHDDRERRQRIALRDALKSDVLRHSVSFSSGEWRHATRRERARRCVRAPACCPRAQCSAAWHAGKMRGWGIPRPRRVHRARAARRDSPDAPRVRAHHFAAKASAPAATPLSSAHTARRYTERSASRSM